MICWHYDHSQNRSVKGINLLNCVYHADGVSLPVTYELIRKPILFSDMQTRQVKRKSLHTKNELMRQMLRTCQHNQLPYRYVLADSWFSAKDNLTFIRKTLDKHFVVALKSNRTVALSYAQKRQGAFTRIDGCELPEHQPVQGWIKGLDFPVLLLRQVFTNQDGSTGTLYLACSDLTCDGAAIEAIYQKRWNVEIFHKTVPRRLSQVAHEARAHPKQPLFYGHLCRRSLGGPAEHRLNHFALRTTLSQGPAMCLR